MDMNNLNGENGQTGDNRGGGRDQGFPGAPINTQFNRWRRILAQRGPITRWLASVDVQSLELAAGYFENVTMNNSGA